MVKRILIIWVVLAIAIAIAGAILPSVDVQGGFLGLMGIALIFGLVNALLGPLLRLLTLPLTAVTFGLFALIVNGLLLLVTAGLSDNLDVGGFFAAVVAALVISTLATVMLVLLDRVVHLDAVPDGAQS